VRSAFNREADKIKTQIEQITGPFISKFVEEMLAAARALNSESRFERFEPFHTLDGGRAVKVRHNGNALAAKQEMIFAALADVRSMRLRSLAEIEAKVAEWRSRLDAMDTSEVIEETVSTQVASDMQPPAEATRTESAFIGASGAVVKVGLTADERLAERLQQLQSDPIFSRRPA